MISLATNKYLEWWSKKYVYHIPAQLKEEHLTIWVPGNKLVALSKHSAFNAGHIVCSVCH